MYHNRFCLTFNVISGIIYSIIGLLPVNAQLTPDTVKCYKIPDPLMYCDGQKVVSVADWEQNRRPELLAMFEHFVYGKLHQVKLSCNFIIDETAPNAFNGLATRKQVSIKLSNDSISYTLHLLVYIPNNVKTKVPVILGLNFYGNHTITPDTMVFCFDNWTLNSNWLEIGNHRADRSKRGRAVAHWQPETILKRGYALATLHYCEISPDYSEGLSEGLLKLYPGSDSGTNAASIAVWAKGLSFALDYIQTDSLLDARNVFTMGHSRLGKTALWAAASDTRFAGAISNNSGCGGAALSKRIFGETVAIINFGFPHWFCQNFKQFNNNEQLLPIDQNQLIALIAPRAVYIASAQNDTWADPVGEFLGALYAFPVFKLYYTSTYFPSVMPQVNQPYSLSPLAYHIRSGQHDVTDFDWNCFLDFISFNLK